jgi:DNA-binding transcriptional MerR regulator
VRIGELAVEAGITTKTVRFYETSGLLPPPERATNGYRDYGPTALSRLDFIRRGRAAGLSLAQIREVIEVRDGGAAPCGHVHQLLTEQIAQVEQRIADLQTLRASLVQKRDVAASADPSTCAPENVCRYV